MKAMIFTPIPVEYQAVRAHLSGLAPVILDGCLYETGVFTGRFGAVEVTLRETGSKNSIVAQATEHGIGHFSPSVVLLVGVAGGVKDVAIGDLVVGTKAYGYESGKHTPEGPVVRPEVMPFSRQLQATAQLVARAGAWQQRCRTDGPAARVFFGPIASGDKVIASTQSSVYQLLRQSFNDTLALEMESIGFAQSACNRPGVHALNIRGISDLLDHKAAGDAHQAVAAGRAAAFAFEMLYELDPSLVNHTHDMDIKDLIKGIYGALFPAALKEIGKDFGDATNNDIRALWKKVKPLFIEDVEALAQNPGDPVAEAAVQNRLHQELSDKPELQAELAGLLEKATLAAHNQLNVSIHNSGDGQIGKILNIGTHQGDMTVH